MRRLSSLSLFSILLLTLFPCSGQAAVIWVSETRTLKATHIYTPRNNFVPTGPPQETLVYNDLGPGDFSRWVITHTGSGAAPGTNVGLFSVNMDSVISGNSITGTGMWSAPGYTGLSRSDSWYGTLDILVRFEVTTPTDFDFRQADFRLTNTSIPGSLTPDVGTPIGLFRIGSTTGTLSPGLWDFRWTVGPATAPLASTQFFGPFDFTLNLTPVPEPTGSVAAFALVGWVTGLRQSRRLLG
jgi:hypothetical protein